MKKRALIEWIGSECSDLDVPFFLEPVVYDANGLDPRSPEFARRKPRWVIDTIAEFSKSVYKVDVLKVEFPVIAAYVEGSAVYNGHRVYTIEEALEYFRAADAAVQLPYIYLSAGVDSAEFLESLRLALRARVRFSGVLCGRANWQEGVPEYAKSGSRFDAGALEEWLETRGLANVRAINDLLRSATPWLAGLIVESSGSSKLAFLISAAIALTGAVLWGVVVGPVEGNPLENAA